MPSEPIWLHMWHMWRNSVQPIIAIPDVKSLGWVFKNKILWMHEAFPEEIDKVKQESDDGNKDHEIRSIAESNDSDDIYVIIWWVIKSGFSIILQKLNNIFLTEQSLRLTYLKDSWILYFCWSNISFCVCYPLLPYYRMSKIFLPMWLS